MSNFITDIRYLLSKDDESINNIIEKLNSSNTFEDVAEKVGLNKDSFRIINILIGLKINNKLFKKLIRNDNPYKITKEEQKRVATAVNKVKKTGLIDRLIEDTRKRKIETFGIPHLSSMTAVLDLRIVKIDDKIKFNPIIILNLKTRNTGNLNDISENELVLQCSEEELEKISVSLRSLNKKIKDDIFHIKQKDFVVEMI